MGIREKINPVKRKLEELSNDYVDAVGANFRYFFCPLLLKDELVPLCQAHIVNQAFPNASRRWTVQRADLDNFYGAFFEADFVDLKEEGSNLEVSIANGFAGRLRPEISYRGQKVQFYVPNSKVPSKHSEVLFESPSGSVRLALKIDPKTLADTRQEDWQISIEKDCRLAALVSLIKAAHLTLFEMLGYRYALSAGGLFVGNEILGKFFSANQGCGKEEILQNARIHFAEFVNLVRPVMVPNTTIEDTVNDRIVYICEGSCRWAFLVFIRTAGTAHAVIVPQMESPDAAARFVSFLKERGSKFQARRCYFDGDAYQAEPATKAFDWPEVTLD